MNDTMKHEHGKASLSRSVELHTGVKSARCYQCGKCSAGCPMAQEMDYTPSMAMRILQVEEDDTDLQLLKSESIWLCLTCEMCISRCPMNVDIPKVMDYLREEALAKGIQNPKSNKNIINFHQSFMDMVRNTGRSFELGLVVDYKLRSLNLFQDISLVPGMLKKGKLPLLPESMKGVKQIANIFKATQKSK
jgi:heterodisulfide reductase subunit C2